MFKKFWKILKDNFNIILGVTTAIITCTYSFLKLLIYVYWSGYFHELNIDTSFMKLSYEGFVFQVVFIAIMLCAVMCVMYLVENMFKNTWEKIRKKAVNIWKKTVHFLWENTLNLILSFVLLTFVNYPIGLALCAWNRFEYDWNIMFCLIIALFAMEILFLVSMKINSIGVPNEKRSIEKRVFINIVLIAVFICSIFAGAYYAGSQSVAMKEQLKLVEGEMFAITYSDGDKYILHEVEIKEDTVIIYRNKQKVINNTDVMCIGKKFEKISISN